MRVIWSWLKEFVDYEGSPEELTQGLTMSGVEAGSVERVGVEFEPIRVGEILEISPHPQADKLQVCTVSTGDEMKKIVCGAPNVARGQRVAVVPPDTMLPSRKRIEATEIRGVLSEGMICSAGELGFQDAQDGIWVLDETCEVGAPLSEAAGLSDYVFEVEVTPNRGDCLSILGIAREVASLQRIPLHPSKPRVLEHGTPVQELLEVAVETPALCPRYTARVIQGVEMGVSPLWMQWRLHHSGIRPINNVVDATNYVMHERGQPLHAFDLEKIRGGRIVVREWTGGAGESFWTLDNEERVPPESACMICDREGPVAIGGVMGGMNSEVDLKSTSIVLESAYFQPESVRRTARALGISTEASYRFERGVNPEGTPLALDRVAELIRRMAGGRTARGFADVCQTDLLEKRNIILRTPQIKRVLGMDLSIREVSEILLCLGLEATPIREQDHIAIQVPLHRPDLTREIDVIEEVARIHGYDRFPATLPSSGEIHFGPPSEWELLCRVGEVLSGAGLVEAVNLSFVSDRELSAQDPPEHDSPEEKPTDLSGGDANGGTVRLLNPMSQGAALLRPRLWPGLLKNAAANLNHNVQDVQIYEAGRVFLPRPESPSDPLPIEPLHIAALLNQGSERKTWTHKDQGRDFYDIKGILEHLFDSFGIKDVSFTPGSGRPFHPARSGTVWCKWGELKQEERVGEVGEIHPDILRSLDIAQPVFLFEIKADPLEDAMRRSPRFQPLPKFPASSRDLAVVVPQEVTMQELRRTILDAGSPLVRSAEAFDVHTGENIPAGNKSIAFALEYRSDERTLTGEEVAEVHDRIVAKLAGDFQAELR